MASRVLNWPWSCASWQRKEKENPMLWTQLPTARNKVWFFPTSTLKGMAAPNKFTKKKKYLLWFLGFILWEGLVPSGSVLKEKSLCQKKLELMKPVRLLIPWTSYWSIQKSFLLHPSVSHLQYALIDTLIHSRTKTSPKRSFLCTEGMNIKKINFPLISISLFAKVMR